MLQDKCMKIIEKIKQLYFTFTILLQAKFFVSAVVTCSSLCLKDAGSNPGNANRQKQAV